MTESDRFEINSKLLAFDQPITNVWAITDELQVLMQGLERFQIDPQTHDFICNYLIGLITIYDVKFQNLHEMITQNLIKPESNDD